MKHYEYLILRYVHNVSTEEFANIGLVMWVPEDRRMLHLVSERYARISAFFDGFDGPRYRNMVRRFKSKLRDVEKMPMARVESIDNLVDIYLPREDSCFQWSAMMSGLATHPEDRLQKLFDRIVTRHSSKQDRERHNERDIYQRLVTRLQSRALIDKLEKDVELNGEHFGYQFKLGWQNGTKQFLEPISFDYTSGTEVREKAYTWSGRLHDLAKKNTFKMTGVVAPPQDPNLMPQYAEALEVLLESPNVRNIVPIDHFDTFVPEIERDLASVHE